MGTVGWKLQDITLTPRCCEVKCTVQGGLFFEKWQNGNSHLYFGSLSRLPLHEGDTATQHEDREPLQFAEGTLQHEDCAQSCAGDLQLVRHLEARTRGCTNTSQTRKQKNQLQNNE